MTQCLHSSQKRKKGTQISWQSYGLQSRPYIPKLTRTKKTMLRTPVLHQAPHSFVKGDAHIHKEQVLTYPVDEWQTPVLESTKQNAANAVEAYVEVVADFAK